VNLTWHIVKKDLRQMAVPVGVWVGFVVVSTFVWGRLPFQVEPHLAQLGGVGLMPAAGSWTSQMIQISSLLASLHAGIGSLLAVHFLQQDSLVGTTGFWSTRPISNGRLLRAKLLGALMLFIVFPAIVMAGVWLSFGFSLAEAAHMTAEFSSLHLWLIVIAMSVATLTGNLGTFLFAAIGAVCSITIGKVLFGSTGAIPIGRRFSFELLLVLGPLALLVGQFLTAKRRLGWWMYGGVLLLLVMTRFGEFPGASAIAHRIQIWSRPGPPSTPEDRSLAVRLGPVIGDDTLSIRPIVTGRDVPGLVLAITGLTFVFPTERHAVLRSWSMGSLWGGPAALRVVGGKASESPPYWDFGARFAEPITAGARSEFRQAGIDLSWVEPRVLWTAPIAVGAVAGNGSNTTRIVSVGVENGRALILCRETDMHYGWSSWPNEREIFSASRYDLYADCYVVTDSETGEQTVGKRWDSSAAALHGIVVTIQGVSIPTSASANDVAAWLAHRTLTKVRFFHRHDIHVTFAAGKLDEMLPVTAGTR
jgi:hypothetical protein